MFLYIWLRGGNMRIFTVWEKVKRNLEYLLNYYSTEVLTYITWWQWNIPYEIIQIAISMLVYKYISIVFGGDVPVFKPYGGFVGFIIIGLAMNSLLDASLEAYYQAVGGLYFSKIGLGGQTLGMIDYLRLANVSPYTFMLAVVSFSYLTRITTALLYLLVGAIVFGVYINPSANISLALVLLICGLIACSGIGLISASMYWLAESYRGVEPIKWGIRVLVPLISGVYFPMEYLPQELKYLNSVLPHTYTINGVRDALIKGVKATELWPSVERLILLSLIYVPIGILLLRYSLHLAWKKGTMY